MTVAATASSGLAVTFDVEDTQRLLSQRNERGDHHIVEAWYVHAAGRPGGRHCLQPAKTVQRSFVVS